jgi:hypothetical protein
VCLRRCLSSCSNDMERLGVSAKVLPLCTLGNAGDLARVLDTLACVWSE